MSGDAYLAEIRMFAGNFPPRDWAFCNGQILAIKDHQALFSLLGTMYGGDGRTSFALPDLRSRVPIHSGDGNAGPGLRPYRLGERGGWEEQELTVGQMPEHSHQITIGGGSGGATADLKVFQGNGDTANPTEAEAVASSVAFGIRKLPALGQSSNAVIKDAVSNIQGGGVPDSTQNTGGSRSISNMQPYAAINFIICLDGVYPPRS